tara:strand:+ start:307 stop:543 length:237 start_codon:yes stop_codon:yes gene_type:complete
VNQEMIQQQSKLLEEIKQRDKTIDALKSFIMSICKALKISNSQLEKSILEEYYKILGENNSQENTKTEGCSETGQNSL